jgi:hypothetical protein
METVELRCSWRLALRSSNQPVEPETLFALFHRDELFKVFLKALFHRFEQLAWTQKAAIDKLSDQPLSSDSNKKPI